MTRVIALHVVNLNMSAGQLTKNTLSNGSPPVASSMQYGRGGLAMDDGPAGACCLMVTPLHVERANEESTIDVDSRQTP